MRPGTTLVVEGDRVAHVTPQAIAVDDARTLGCEGRVALPAPIDAHVAATAVTHDLAGPKQAIGLLMQGGRVRRRHRAQEFPAAAPPSAWGSNSASHPWPAAIQRPVSARASGAGSHGSQRCGSASAPQR